MIIKPKKIVKMKNKKNRLEKREYQRKGKFNKYPQQMLNPDTAQPHKKVTATKKNGSAKNGSHAKTDTRFLQGEIVIVDDLTPDKTALLKKKRPAIVISNDAVNRSPRLIVVKLTSQCNKLYPSHALLTNRDGTLSVAVGDQPMSIDKANVVKTNKRISEDDLKKVIQSVLWSIKSDY